LLACDDSVPRTLGLGEPIRVHNGQFIPGDLPAQNANVPTITNVTLTNPTVLYAEANKSFNGRASKEAQSVGVRVAGLGTGFWIVPMGPLDNQFPGEQTWQTTSDFDPLAMAASPGPHKLRYVAMDQNGNAGPPTDVDVCFDPKIPDNGALCDPSKTPPAAVLTLTFDADADVDLVVVGPDHTTDPKHPTTIPPDAGVLDPASGVLDRDSLSGCVKDGRRQEDLVWNVLPTGITFDVYARLFDACGNAGVSYDVTLYTFSGTTPVATTHAAKGVFTSYDVSPATNGTYLFTFQL
jgi:hypothetical protein